MSQVVSVLLAVLIVALIVVIGLLLFKLRSLQVVALNAATIFPNEVIDFVRAR